MRGTPERNTRVLKKLYEEQDRLCKICDTEMPHKDEKGHTVRKYEDKPTGVIVCAKCHFLLYYLRKRRGRILDRAIQLIEIGEAIV